jgi:hypothetical protein
VYSFPAIPLGDISYAETPYFVMSSGSFSGNDFAGPIWRMETIVRRQGSHRLKHVGPGEMTVESGLIQTHGGMGLLYWTGGKLGDCVIRVVYKMRDENDNSGVFIRIPIEPREAWMPVNYGYEVQIDNVAEGEDEYHITGMLYSLTKPLARPGKPGPQWNTMEITLDGPHTIVTVNGVKVTDYTEGDPVPEKKFEFEPERGPRPQDGYFGLQNHSKDDVVFFKEVAVKMLKK